VTGRINREAIFGSWTCVAYLWMRDRARQQPPRAPELLYGFFFLLLPIVEQTVFVLLFAFPLVSLWRSTGKYYVLPLRPSQTVWRPTMRPSPLFYQIRLPPRFNHKTVSVYSYRQRY
jgi:hypothetical protein